MYCRKKCYAKTLTYKSCKIMPFELVINWKTCAQKADIGFLYIQHVLTPECQNYPQLWPCFIIPVQSLLVEQ